MNHFKPAEFVTWAVWYAKQYGTRLTPIRIVKFLYLADLYNARIDEGRTLTGWSWKFVHYGPFCVEALRAIDEAESRGQVQSSPYQSRFDKDTKLYDFAGGEPPERYPETLPHYVCSEVKARVRQYADDTYALLNFVYFETEPMLAGQPGDILDFSNAHMPEKHVELAMQTLPQKQRKAARSLVRNFSQRRAKRLQALQQKPSPIFDSAYRQAITLLDGEDDRLVFDGTLDLTK